MLLFITAPELLSELAHLENQLQAPQSSIAAPATSARTERPKLTMVWHKEFDGTREHRVARWVIDR